MSKVINKIVIVGGGSAGWMSASTLISTFPQKEIVVIESPNVPTVGVGESTIGGINNWCNLIGIKDTDFMKFTDASYKLSIRFCNFYKKDSGAFHYPFGPTNSSGHVSRRNDWYFKKFLHPETPVSDYAECMYPQMALVNENKLDTNIDLPGFVFERDTAYHFDATKFGIWLRENLCKPRGVVHKQAEVVNAVLNEDGIDKLILDNGEECSADLFIDCTGFKSLLLSGYMKEPFNSYEEMLPNNSAWATRVPFTDKRKQLNSWTDCEAINNGWVWTIPLWSRIGTGYVYSDKYINDADALEEFKDHLRSKNLYREDLEYKNIKMRVGIHQRLWVNNVCAIGLSAGFIEPLESSGLFTVHEFLLKLIRTLYRGSVSQWDKDAFSSSCISQFREFSEFVALHYALSHRDDTEYWRAVGKRVYAPRTIDHQFNMQEILGFNNAINAKFKLFGFGTDEEGGGFHCISTGMNNFPTDPFSLKAYTYPSPRDDQWKEFFTECTKNLDKKKAEWKAAVKNTPSMYDFIEQKYYKDNT
jgi:tryptophan halogenase